MCRNRLSTRRHTLPRRVRVLFPRRQRSGFQSTLCWSRRPGASQTRFWETASPSLWLPHGHGLLLVRYVYDVKNDGTALGGPLWLSRCGGRGVRLDGGTGRGQNPRQRGEDWQLCPQLLKWSVSSGQLRDSSSLLSLPLLLLMFKSITDEMEAPAAALISAAVWAGRCPDRTRSD